MNILTKKIIIYTLSISALLLFYKLIIVNQFFNNEFTSNYFLLNFLLKLSLFIVSVYLIKDNNLILRQLNKNRLITILLISILLYFTYQGLLAKSIKYDLPVFNAKLIFYSLSNLSIGFFEEFYFRVLIFGLVYKVSKNKKLFNITLISSAIFAIVHIENLFLKSYTITDILFQITFAFAVGIIFQLIIINYKNIYFASFIHALNDFKSNFDSKIFNITKSYENDNGFDFETLIILSILLITIIIISYFNLRNKKTISFIQPIQ